jgi:gas vesicle protein
MNRPSQVLTALTGIAITAAGAYLLDPDNGKRRRSELGDKCKNAAKKVNERAHTLGGQVKSGYKDASVRARSWLDSDQRGDKTLARRVRMDLWRAVPDTERVGVIAHDGEVILHGDVLASEHDHVLNVARGVEGVRSVADHLYEREAFERPSGAGRVKQGFVTVRNNLMQDKWTPPTRFCGGTVGLGLLGWGVRHRNAVGIIGAVTGAALVLRSASNVPFSRFAGKSRSALESGYRKVKREAKDATQTVKDEAAHVGNAASATANDWRNRATAS